MVYIEEIYFTSDVVLRNPGVMDLPMSLSSS